jgi:hypothetical protein
MLYVTGSIPLFDGVLSIFQLTGFFLAASRIEELYTKARSIGCFIKKPVTIEYLAKRLSTEMD